MSPGKALIAKQKGALEEAGEGEEGGAGQVPRRDEREASKDEKSKARDRMRYLLKQADIFQHFMNVTAGRQGKGKAKAGEGAGARGRKREEEDKAPQGQMDDGKALTRHD